MICIEIGRLYKVCIISGIKMSNTNDSMELRAFKPVSLIDHQINPEERSLKDISVTVDGTNIKKKAVQIKNGKFCY